VTGVPGRNAVKVFLQSLNGQALSSTSRGTDWGP